MLKYLATLLSFGFFILAANSEHVYAHEFWIEPDKPTADLKAKMFAHVRVGQNFKGPAQYYIPSNIRSAKITGPGSSAELKRIVGDYPVFDAQANEPSLQILSYHSADLKLTYNSFEKFEKFVRNQGLDWVIERHKQRSLPDADFSEYYVRYAKALLTRGGTAGQDQKIGMKFELIAQINTYELDPANSQNLIPIKLLWRGKPMTGSQISVFEKTDAEASKSHITTDNAGIARLAVNIGRTYMLSSVHMTEEKPEDGAVWRSHWASLTFTASAKP